MNFASFKNALEQVVQSASSSARDFGASVRVQDLQLCCPDLLQNYRDVDLNGLLGAHYR